MRDVSFTLPPGAALAVVGRNGMRYSQGADNPVSDDLLTVPVGEDKDKSMDTTIQALSGVMETSGAPGDALTRA